MNPDRVIGDETYDSGAHRQRLAWRHIEQTAPQRRGWRPVERSDGRSLRGYGRWWSLARWCVCIGLLILSIFGASRLNAHEGEDPCDVSNKRRERGSILVSSNRDHAECPAASEQDPARASVALDRLAHRHRRAPPAPRTRPNWSQPSPRPPVAPRSHHTECAGLRMQIATTTRRGHAAWVCSSANGCHWRFGRRMAAFVTSSDRARPLRPQRRVPRGMALAEPCRHSAVLERPQSTCPRRLDLRLDGPRPPGELTHSM